MRDLRAYLSSFPPEKEGARDCGYPFPKGYENIRLVEYRAGGRRVYAFIGVPERAEESSCHCAVLVHGGGGQAYYEWVKKWTERGYVAIAPDFNGHMPVDESRRSERDLSGGPEGYGSIGDAESEEPWMYFSVLNILRAADIVSREKCADKNNVALCGISWGGFLSLSAAGVSDVFKAVSVVYSSAYISDSEWGREQGIGGLTAHGRELYDAHIDPQSYLAGITCPVFFAAGTDDTAFTMRNRKRTSDAVPARKIFSYRLHFPHGHYVGWEGGESIAFTDSIFNGKALAVPRAKLCGKELRVQGEKGAVMTLVFTEEDFYGKDACVWEERAITDGRIRLAGKERAFFVTSESGGVRLSTDVMFPADEVRE